MNFFPSSGLVKSGWESFFKGSHIYQKTTIGQKMDITLKLTTTFYFTAVY